MVFIVRGPVARRWRFLVNAARRKKRIGEKMNKSSFAELNQRLFDCVDIRRGIGAYTLEICIPQPKERQRYG